MAMRRARQFPGAMPEQIAFARRQPARRARPPRVDAAFATALLISLVLVVPPAFLGWSVAGADGYAGIVLAVLVGSVASVLVTFLAARAWLRFSKSDRLFADATLTGWVRVRRAQRQVARARDVFDDPNVAPIKLHVDRLVAIAHSLEARDARTHRHSTRVAMRAVSVAKQLGLDSDEVARVRAAAKLHDIGALHAPSWASASDAERAEVAIAGASLLEFTGDRELIATIRHQHERFDGAGTPDGLIGAAIPLPARIIAVADAYDLAVREKGQRDALKQLTEGAGSRFDPAVVDAVTADAGSNPTAAIRGALSGAFPRAAQSAADLLRGTASVAAAASIATTAVVTGGVGVETIDHGERGESRSSAVVAGTAAAGGGETAGGQRGNSGDRDGKSGSGDSRRSSEGESQPSNSDSPAAGQRSSGAGNRATEADAGSSGSGTNADKTLPSATPVKDLTDTVTETVDNTTQTVDDTVQGVVDTVDDTVKNTTQTVDDVVGGLTGNRK